MWTQKYVLDFLAEVGGIITSLLAGTSFFVTKYQQFVSEKSMLKRLYGEEQSPPALDDDASDKGQQQSSKEKFKDKLDRRKELEASFCQYTLFSCLKLLCCARCCKPQLERNKKFEVALERLNKERDVQFLIQVNRVTKLLQKTKILPRQRKAVAFSHDYVISEHDIARSAAEESKNAGSADTIDTAGLIRGFDPDNDKIDRRIYFEVTGEQVIEDEFANDYTSDEEWMLRNARDPLAFMLGYKVDTEESDNDQSQLPLIPGG